MSSFSSSKQNELIELLCVLYVEPLNRGQIGSICSKLDSLYDGGFRHKYSDFLRVVQRAFDENGELASLLSNLEYIEAFCIQNESHLKNVDSILKLVDHMNLECSRFDASTKVQSQFDSFESDMFSMHDDIVALHSSLDDAEAKLKHSQIDIITAMSIFSAVVLTFFGGVNYISGAISAAPNTPAVKLTFIVILAGAVMFNIIIGVLSILNKIINSSNAKPVKPWFVIIMNIVFILLLSGIVVCSKFFPCILTFN